MYQFKNSEYYSNTIIIGCQALGVIDGVVTFHDIEEMHKYQHGLSLNGFARIQKEVSAPEDIVAQIKPENSESEAPIEHDDSSEDMDH